MLTKASINRRGYNKFLTISKDVQVVINEQEIENERVKTLFLTEKHQRIKPLFDIKAILDKKQD